MNKTIEINIDELKKKCPLFNEIMKKDWKKIYEEVHSLCDNYWWEIEYNTDTSAGHPNNLG